MPDYSVCFVDGYRWRVDADDAAEAERLGYAKFGDAIEKVVPCPPDSVVNQIQKEQERCQS